MTTRLSKPVAREAYAPRWGDLVITLAPEGIILREKGRRTKYGPIPFGRLMMLGAQMKAEEQRRAKVEASKARKLAKGSR